MKSISEWLNECGSHDIYDAGAIKLDFEQETGESAADFPTHSVRMTRRSLAGDPRGGHVNGNDDDRCVYGYELAAHLARKYAGHSSAMMGRGFLFRDCVEALKRAGK